jgi:hypothetical protein
MCITDANRIIGLVTLFLMDSFNCKKNQTTYILSALRDAQCVCVTGEVKRKTESTCINFPF